MGRERYKICESCAIGQQIKADCCLKNNSIIDAAMDTIHEYDKCLEKCHIVNSEEIV